MAKRAFFEATLRPKGGGNDVVARWGEGDQMAVVSGGHDVKAIGRLRAAIFDGDETHFDVVGPVRVMQAR